MTLRLKENHLRLRLTRSDLDALRQTGRVEQITRFGPDATFTCALVADADLQAPAATFAEGRLAVRLPASLAADWAATDRVSIEAECPAGEGHVLRLLVEKDIGCQHKDEAERADKFTALAEKA